jgi:hypothetical protein
VLARRPSVDDLFEQIRRLRERFAALSAHAQWELRRVASVKVVCEIGRVILA